MNRSLSDRLRTRHDRRSPSVAEAKARLRLQARREVIIDPWRFARRHPREALLASLLLGFATSSSKRFREGLFGGGLATLLKVLRRE